MNCEECAQFQKKIRVMLSDHQFELRKLRQDKAEQRALFQINIQKELRKWQERYNKEKSEHQQNNKKWLNKVDETTVSCQSKLQQAEKVYQSALYNEITSLKSTYESGIRQIRQTFQAQIMSIKINNEKQSELIQATHKNEIQELTGRFKRQTDRLNAESQEKQESMKKYYESKLFGLQIQKTTESNRNVALQEEHRKERSKYLGEIYDTKVLVKTLQQNLKILKSRLEQKEQQIERFKSQIKLLNDLIKSEKAVNEEQKLRIKREWEELFQKKKVESLERELQVATKYEVSVKVMDQKRQYEQRIYSNNLTEVRNFIENRPSRLQDIEQILVIRQKLSKKQKQYQSLQKQAKSYQLELQNKEDTYNRIFMPSVSSTHLNDSHSIKRKEIRIKRPGKSLSTVRDMLSANLNSSHLPSLNSIDKKLLPPKSTKIL